MSPPWGEQAGRIHLLSSEENGQNKFLRAYQALTSSYWSDHQTRSDPSLLTDVLRELSESPSEPSRSQVLSPAASLDWIWTVVVFKRESASRQVCTTVSFHSITSTFLFVIISHFLSDFSVTETSSGPRDEDETNTDSGLIREISTLCLTLAVWSAPPQKKKVCSSVQI